MTEPHRPAGQGAAGRGPRAAGMALAMLAALAGLGKVGAVWAAADPRLGPATVMLEELSSSELKARIDQGTRTALLPIGGTEQNGPHMALGKHNQRARLLAARIAERLGQAVVAPVMAYVPEGEITPPSQHMRWSGTLSISEAAFEAVIEGAARSLCQHGLRDVVLLPEHGGYLKSVERVAQRLNQRFATQQGAGAACHVLALTRYYQVTQTDYVEALKARGHGSAEIGQHAGLADTSLMLALDPAMVRLDVAAARPAGAADGVTGDPRRASAELGRLGSERIVEVSLAAILASQRQRAAAGAGGAGGATMAAGKNETGKDMRKPAR